MPRNRQTEFRRPAQTAEANRRCGAALGIDTFILSGYPHLEEAYHFAEHVFPRLTLTRTAENGRLGEVVANGALRIPGGGANAVPPDRPRR